jgi:adenylate cyclase
MQIAQSAPTLAPQCGICGTLLTGPLSHVFRAAGIKRSARNPNICSRCDTHVEEGLLVEVTVLFVDLSSFTELTQELGPERTHELVDAFLRTATDAITRQGGFIDKYIGDAVMALFNVPIKQSDHARRAVAAAMELQSRMGELGRRFQMDLKAAAGIASGWARVGRLGSGESRDITAIGDVVNLAARLEAKTCPGEVLVSGDVYSNVADNHPGVPEERLSLKGFKEPLAAYRLAARSDLPHPVDMTPPDAPRSVSWGAVVFSVLGAPCAVATLIGPLAVALGVGTLFGLGGALSFLDQSAIRVPVLVLATLGAFANLYTLWRARQLRAEERLDAMTRLEKRRTAVVAAAAVATLAIVIFELITHTIRHST